MKRLKPLPLKPRRGFVLVLTLAMILIAVMITGRAANRSLSRTLQTIDAEQQLQRRWEHMSLQRTLLGRAGSIFATHTEPNQTHGEKGIDRKGIQQGSSPDSSRRDQGDKDQEVSTLRDRTGERQEGMRSL